MLQKTKGIVLKQRNIGENDRILTLLTASMGLIEGAARRVKSPKSPLAAACQLFAYSEFCLFRGRQSYYIIDSAETLHSFYPLRMDVEKTALAGYFCELTDQLSPTPDNSGEILRLLLNTLHFLQEDKQENGWLKSLYELRVLSAAGFMPNLVGCAECGEYEKEGMLFLPLEGILICSDCFAASPYNRQNVIRAKLPPAVLAAMRHIVFSEPERLFSFRLTGSSLALFTRITEIYVRLHTEGKFPSLEVYRSLLAAAAPDGAAGSPAGQGGGGVPAARKEPDSGRPEE